MDMTTSYTRSPSGLKPLLETRATLDAIRQQHMLALQAAIANGTASDELVHDLEAFYSAASQLLELCSTRTGQAPLWLGVPS